MQTWKTSVSAVALATLSFTGVAVHRATAAQLQVLYNFTGGGAGPSCNLVKGPDGNFYGTTQNGGTNQQGSVFRIATDGALTTLFSFNVANGRNPVSGLTLGNDGNFYGTTYQGGASDWGTLFKVTTNGVLTTLVNFTMANGGDPHGALALGKDGNFYGTTRNGGAAGFGTVFKMTPDGQLTTLANFNSANGARPESDLILGRDDNFYGATYYGGSADNGTVFKVTTNGTLTTLVNFTGANGANPTGGLTQGKDGNFYGTTYIGGSSGLGTVFRMTANGNLTTLVNFTGNNGETPGADLTLGPDGNFYGTTVHGGIPNSNGTIFKMTPDGALTSLFSFTEYSDGSRPYGGFPYSGLTLGSDGNFYGASYSGVNGGGGTIYRLDLPPFITSQPDSRFKSVGTTVSFKVMAAGGQPLIYQWLKNGTALTDGGNVSGANSTKLTLSDIQPNDAGNYSVIVSNYLGSITSSIAVLTVLQHGHSALVSLGASVPDPSAPVNISGPSLQSLTSTPAVNVLTFEGTPNYQYVVQYTTDILNGPWQTLSTNSADTNGTCVVIDPAPGGPQRFYRCVSQ